MQAHMSAESSARDGSKADALKEGPSLTAGQL